MRQRAVAVLQIEPVQPQRAHGAGDLDRHGLGRAHVHRAVLDVVIELRGRQRRPTTVTTDPVPGALEVWVQQLARLLIGRGDEPGHVHPHRLGGHRQLAQRPVEQIHVGAEPLGVPADHGEHQPEAVARGAHHRLRRPADADPHRDRPALGGRVHLRRLQGGSVRAAPGDRTLGVHSREQVQLLAEQPLVVGQVVTEQRERLGERTASQGDLGAAVGERVKGGESLEDADRVVRTQHCYGRPQRNPLGARRDRGQEHVGSGDGVVVAVVLADAEGVHPDLICQHRLRDHLADRLRGGVRRSVGLHGDVAEGVQSELHAAWVLHALDDRR